MVMIDVDTQIRYIAEDVLDDMFIDDVRYFIEEYGNEECKKRLKNVKEAVQIFGEKKRDLN